MCACEFQVTGADQRPPAEGDGRGAPTTSTWSGADALELRPAQKDHELSSFHYQGGLHPQCQHKQ